ncbi:MAG: DUF7134 domain-containing protein, partial [Acidimicrobiales bacterium]
MESPLRAMSGTALHQWLREHPFTMDLLIAGLFAIVGLIITQSVTESLSQPNLAGPEGVLQWLVVFGATWALPFRRLAPTAAVATGTVLQAIVWAFSFPDTYVAMALLIYSAAAHGGPRGRRAAWIASALLTGYT